MDTDIHAESTFPAFERAKTVHALDAANTLIARKIARIHELKNALSLGLFNELFQVIKL
jgi:hypothetical protein